MRHTLSITSAICVLSVEMEKMRLKVGCCTMAMADDIQSHDCLQVNVANKVS